MGSIRGLVAQRWEEARDALRSTDFEAFANLGSEANRRLMLLLSGSMSVAGGAPLVSEAT